jgi:TldD protein
MPGSRGSFTYDDEGAPASKTVMIENGVLKTYLHNRITAARSGAVSTGNGRRQNYTNQPIVRMTNTFIAPGKDKLDDIIRNTDRGLFVKKMGGGQVNTINGDFVFDVQEGYRIESGKIGEPIRGATLTGNGPKVLEIIDRVGGDLGFSVGTCGKNGQEVPISCGQPSLRIPEIIVGGTG